MAGSTMSVGVIACAAVLAVGLTSAAGALVFSQRLSAAADAAALAAADAASGAVAGVPCERADEVAAAGGAVLSACDLDGLIATVTVSGRFGGIEASAMARAGPPPASP
ncbi:Rv3654c family TadE-like protein [Microbacterium sp. SLBN-146]|uniref:Rv3654c family TadE-like protein n=1 Tax=Microbacterium sp. SLBN-146 TaxID=2768457 RepID=UPI00114F54A7|nr:Rv3654c family TadE-like protein [Microbacterium sp. SLBN-146]TQJ31382.1 secretion/DNA translocation related TadE-like protein [Microbacterium sp. SLBN-146]